MRIRGSDMDVNEAGPSLSLSSRRIMNKRTENEKISNEILIKKIMLKIKF